MRKKTELLAISFYYFATTASTMGLGRPISSSSTTPLHKYSRTSGISRLSGGGFVINRVAPFAHGDLNPSSFTFAAHVDIDGFKARLGAFDLDAQAHRRCGDGRLRGGGVYFVATAHPAHAQANARRKLAVGFQPFDMLVQIRHFRRQQRFKISFQLVELMG